MGYSYLVNKTDATDVRYFLAAKSIGLMDGISANPTELLKSGVFVKMLKNSLDVDMKIRVMTGAEVEYISAGTYMETNKISKRSGKVEATAEASVYMPEGTVVGMTVINGVKYFTDSDMRPYLGYNVEYWTKATLDDDYETILCVFPKNYNKEITVDADDIKYISPDMRRLEYYEDGENTEKVNIESGFALIYNGKYRLKKDASYLKPSLGKVTLLDNDGDGKYEVVSVRAYDVYIVNYVYDGVIYDQNGKTPLDLSDEENIRSIIKNGDEASIRFISADDVVYAAVSADGKYIEINASNKKIEGTVTAIEEFGDYRYYTIDGTEYLASSELNADDIIDCNGIFYFGPTGIIERQLISQAGDYGILIGAAEEGGLGNMQVKIFTSDGSIKVYDIADNAMLYDGQQAKIGLTELAKLDAYAKSYITPPQTADVTTVSAPIIMYTEGKDGIKTISLPELYDDEKNGVLRERYSLQSVTSKENMLHRRSYNRFMGANRSMNATTDVNFSDGKTKFIDGNTIIFEVPVSADGSISAGYEEEIKVTNGNRGFANWLYGNFYNFDENRTVGAMVYYKQSGTVDELHGMLIKSKATALNSDGEKCTVLCGYKDGEYVSYEVKNDVTISTSRIAEILKDVPKITVESLEKGDYIFIETDDKGRIIFISPMVLAKYDNSKYLRYHNSIDFSNYGEMIFGEVVKVRDKVIEIQLDSNFLHSDQLVFYENNYKGAIKALYDMDNDTVSGRTDVVCEGDYVLIMRDASRILDMFVRRKQEG